MAENKDALEIENKYLLKCLPKETPNEVIDIEQVYCRKNNMWERVRMSISDFYGTYYTHTIKIFISKGINREIEKNITEAEYSAFKYTASNTVGSKILYKKRHVYNVGNYKWEIEKNKKMNYSLVIAEFEKPSKTFKVKKPKFLRNLILCNVTKNSKFSNRNLAFNL